jgi:hypothetical protein
MMISITKKKYIQLIESFKRRYLNKYLKGRRQAGDKNYFRAKFHDILRKNGSKIYSEISDAIQYQNEKKWLQNIDSFTALREFCRSHKQDLSKVIQKVAEYEAILLVWPETNKNDENTETTTPNISQNNHQVFRLNEKIISKIDFIRIVNALYELRAFTKSDDTYPTKQETMKLFGKILGIDLSNYDKDLSKALINSKVEANIEIFKKMESMTTSICMNKAHK